ncbi:unnamed protein product [Effrenium voratum]|uniref:Uncharacterized protein n=1 Tax=Effrenium voratum TaxID=2562239 RepID=A0AA36HTR8_9DINO|nr:unnamed protein product [Effrenium voratum]
MKMKLWVGFLEPTLLADVEVFSDGAQCDYFFMQQGEKLYIPLAASLIAAANGHFAFFSAQEEEEEAYDPIDPDDQPLVGVDGRPLSVGGPGSADLETRMGHVESVLDGLQSSMQQLLQMQRSKAHQTPTKTKPAPMPTKLKAKPSSSSGAALKTMDFPHLDPGVVQAALQAGVSHESLGQMERVVLQNARARKTADVHANIVLDPLSEDGGSATEQEMEEAPVGGSGSQVQDPLASSLAKLTNIMELLTEEKQKKTTGSKLDSALDAVQATGSDVTSLGSGKKTAVARRALRSAFQEHPEEVHLLIERLMFEDLNSQTLPPGCQPRGLSARAWVEFRSRIGSYKSSAYSSWCIAGILDSLLANNVPQARARACLGLLQIDQASVDQGSWTLAAELSLEQGPPLTAMSQHVPPDVMQGDSPFSKLLDARWAEVSISHLRDQDEYLTKRRNIGRSTGKPAEESGSLSPDAKKKSRPGAKPKAATTAEKSSDA